MVRRCAIDIGVPAINKVFPRHIYLCINYRDMCINNTCDKTENAFFWLFFGVIPRLAKLAFHQIICNNISTNDLVNYYRFIFPYIHMGR